MKRNGNKVGMQLQTEVRMPVLVKVKSYTRIQRGKTVKVHSYLRRTWDSPKVTIKISTL